MEKYDVKAVHKALYSPPTTDFVLVEVPEFRYLAIDGAGDPNTAPQFAEAIEALYGVAYALKFESKKAVGRDFVVAPLEGLWRAADVNAFRTGDKSSWSWTLLINQPDWISDDMVAAAVVQVSAKKQLAALGRLTLRTLAEGTSVQILHVGSYDDEAPTLERMHNTYLPEHHLDFNGDHHEIYLSDTRRTAPARLRTILRQPVKPVGE